MELLKKSPFTTSILFKLLCIAVIAVSIYYTGYMFGKLAWYLTH